MPLRGIIDNKDVYSFDYTDDDWVRLKKDVKCGKSILTLNCCKQKGFLRTSHKGLKHFVHAKKNTNCEWKPESHEHLQAKIEIVEACRDNGWEAIPEYNNQNWKADVLAIKDNKRIVFEVQLSYQTYEKTMYRQQRYKESNVRCCWFFKNPPTDMTDLHGLNIYARKEIPAFRIIANQDLSLVISFNFKDIPLKSFVGDLLTRKYKFCAHTASKSIRNITVFLKEVVCWNCHKKQYVYDVLDYYTPLSVCGKKLELQIDLNRNEYIDSEIRNYLAESKYNYINIGPLKTRYSNSSEGNKLSLGCFYCDALFSKLFIKNEWNEDYTMLSMIQLSIPLGNFVVKNKYPHWCYSHAGEFCE